MENKSAILLNEHFENQLTIGGEFAYVVLEYNASTGYHWEYRPDNSGTVELVEVISLHPSTKATGVPGKMCWKFKAERAGRGSILFELYPPGKSDLVAHICYKVMVK